MGTRQKSNTLDDTLRAGYRVLPGQDVIIHSRQPEVDHPSHLPQLVQKLKGIAGDIPVGVKFGAGKYLEKDMTRLWPGEWTLSP